MISKEAVIKNPTGLHARPAAKLVELAKSYESRLFIQADERKCDAKSIFSLLKCNFKQGETVTVLAEGEDEDLALEGLVNYISNLEE